MFTCCSLGILQVDVLKTLLQAQGPAQKQPITTSFASLEAFLADARVRAAKFLPNLLDQDLQLSQLPGQTSASLQQHCSVTWAAADRIVLTASLYAPC